MTGRRPLPPRDAPLTPAEQAPIDPHDPSRAGKWWYSPEDAEVVFPTLTRDPEALR